MEEQRCKMTVSHRNACNAISLVRKNDTKMGLVDILSQPRHIMMHMLS